MKVTLEECPIGLFLYEDELCLKTEYGDNDGRIDAYIVSSGEMFWGDAPQSIISQRAQLVTPVSVWNLPLAGAWIVIQYEDVDEYIRSRL